MNIGDRIKTLRKAKKLTQEQLAEYLHVSAQAVSKWETGASAPDVDMLPRLAIFFDTSVDALLDFDHRRVEEEVAALVKESVPLRADPPKAEAFYRAALEKYPNNDVLLNCLLMVIPNERSAEKLAIGRRLLECTEDAEVRCDVLRLLMQTCRAAGETAMAEHYLAQLPELYSLKTELAAWLRTGAARREEARKTELVCCRILTEMLALRLEDAPDAAAQEDCRALIRRVIDLVRALGHDAAADELAADFAPVHC